MLHLFPDALRSLAAFAVVLGVLVFFHELGHYLAARWRGVHVEAFSIGFGRPLFTRTDRSGTEWRLAWLPLGGYVKLHGQERPEDADEETRARWIPGRTFHEKSVASRAIVVAAGPVANMILAAVLFSFLFMLAGRPVMPPVVGQVFPNTAASRAGLQTGDRILAIDGHAVGRFEDVQHDVVAHPAQTLQIKLRRGGSDIVVPVVTESKDVGGKTIGQLGISAGAPEFHRLSPPRAVAAGIAQTWRDTRDTLIGVGQMITGQRGTADLGGPLRIAQLSGQVAELGVASLVSLIALLSINLALINLFPIPILDGGHLLFFLAEAIRGRPVPPKAQEYGFRAGFALLATLFLFTTWNDLAHLGLFHWVARLIG